MNIRYVHESTFCRDDFDERLISHYSLKIDSLNCSLYDLIQFWTTESIELRNYNINLESTEEQ